MNRRRTTSRWALWAFAFALLLKAAAPLLATAAAQMQGKALVEVCTVYGVATVPQGGSSPEPMPDHGAAHGDDHCALSALLALAAPEPPAAWGFLAVVPAVAGTWVARPAASPPDACAAWVARLHHGPPTLS